MAIATQHHPTALPGRPYISPFVAKPAASVATYTSVGAPWLYTAVNWGSSTGFWFEVYMRQTTGTARARLFDLDVSAAVASSSINTTSATFTRVRTASALTVGAGDLVDGNEYVAQFGKDSGDAGEALGAKIVVVQS